MHQTSTLIEPTQGHVHACGGHQLTLRWLHTKTFTADGDLAAQGDPVVVLKNVVMQCCGCRRSGHCDGVQRAEFLKLAMTHGGHAVHPFDHGRRGIENVHQGGCTGAGEPQRVVARKVGDAGLGTQ